jgi:hypothetical protein
MGILKAQEQGYGFFLVAIAWIAHKQSAYDIVRTREGKQKNKPRRHFAEILSHFFLYRDSIGF